MSKLRKQIDKNDDRQRSLFELLVEVQRDNTAPRAGSLDIDTEVRCAISEELKGCPYSRFHVAARMSELTGTEITKAMLDSWTAESKENHRFPAIFLPAFCVAVGSSRALDFLAQKAGVFVLPGREALRAEIQRDQDKRDRLTKGIKRKKVLLEALKEST
jgi:hypothetical protein